MLSLDALLSTGQDHQSKFLDPTMATGLEIPAAIAGFISLAFEAFEGCIQAYQFIYATQHMGNDGDSVRSKLLWQQYRLWEWGERSSIYSNPLGKLNWNYAAILLKEQKTLLTSAEELKKRYNLHVPEEVITAEEAQDQKCSESALGKLFARIKPDMHRASGRMIQSKNGPLKRLQ